MKLSPPGSSFSLDGTFEDCGYMTREPKRLAELLAARALPGDAEMAELFADFGAILPVALERMSHAADAIENGGPQ